MNDIFQCQFSLSNLSPEQQQYLMSLSDKEKLEFYEKYKKYSESTYESNLELLGNARSVIVLQS